MELLLKEYQESLKAAKAIRGTAPKEDQKIYASMVGSMEYIVKWLRDDQQPAPSKSRTVTWDPEWDEFSDHHDDPFSHNPFEEAENHIDAEIRKRRKMNA